MNEVISWLSVLSECGGGGGGGGATPIIPSMVLTLDMTWCRCNRDSNLEGLKTLLT